MRLRAYTIIEGIISMVILSILLSVMVIVSFNLYRSYPSIDKRRIVTITERKLDSLVRAKQTNDLFFEKEGLSFSYRLETFEAFKNVKIARLSASFQEGKVTKNSLLFVDEED